MNAQVMNSDPNERAEHPDFARRVLDKMPSPLLVVDGTATVIYANAALLAIIGRTGQHAVGEKILDYIHADDVIWLVEAFLDLTQSEPDPDRGDLPSVHVRLLSSSGETIPVEVTGARSISDDVIGGVIYDIRPARHHDLLTHLLAGVSSGAEVVDLLRLVTQLIAMPPLPLDAAVLERQGNDWSVVTSTSAALTHALRFVDGTTFDGITPDPHRCDVAELGDDLMTHITDAGYADTWRLSVPASGDARLDDSRYEIVACNTVHQRVSPAVADRMTQARELARIVMMRSQNDRLMRHAARHDSLTGLLNRLAFRELLADSLTPSTDPAARSDDLAVLFLDLDGFKPINDQHGHASGDAVLKIVAERLTATVRASDAVARLGGDEFAVLLRNDGTRPTGHEAIPERIVECVSAPIALDGLACSVSVTASAGISRLRPDDSVDEVLKRADSLMYDAKRSGGGTTRFEGPTN